MGGMPRDKELANMAMLLGTALFLATIAVALWAIAFTVMEMLPRIVDVFGTMAPPEQPVLRPARLAARR